MVSVALTRQRRVPIWTVNGRCRPLPRLSPGTLALCSPDFPLTLDGPATITLTLDELLSCKRARSNPASRPARVGCGVNMVPKGRFELPRGCPHYALNVARLPVPPLRPVCGAIRLEPTVGFEPTTCCLRNSCSTTELGRRPLPAQRWVVYQTLRQPPRPMGGIVHTVRRPF